MTTINYDKFEKKLQEKQVEWNTDKNQQLSLMSNIRSNIDNFYDKIIEPLFETTKEFKLKSSCEMDGCNMMIDFFAYNSGIDIAPKDAIMCSINVTLPQSNASTSAPIYTMTSKLYLNDERIYFTLFDTDFTGAITIEDILARNQIETKRFGQRVTVPSDVLNVIKQVTETPELLNDMIEQAIDVLDKTNM